MEAEESGLGQRDSPALVVREGWNVGFMRSVMAQHVSALGAEILVSVYESPFSRSGENLNAGQEFKYQDTVF